MSFGKRWPALAVLCAGMLMIILDGSVVAVALPSIQRDLGFTPSTVTWVVNAYLVAFGGLLLLSGRLGDLVGRSRMFLTGLLAFTLASLACGLSTSQEMLVVARFVQGAGGAMASAVMLGMVAALFPEPRERAKAIGVFSFASAAGASIGILAGGVLTQVLSWHWIFFVNVPIGVVLVALALRFIAADRGLGLRAGADVTGALLVTAGLMVAVYTLVTADSRATAGTAVFGTLAAALIVGFVVRQALARRPLLPLGLLRSRDVSGANAVQILLVAGFFGFQFLGALYLQNVLHYGAIETGLAFVPTPIAIAVLSLRVSAPLANRFGARAVLLAGMVISIGGFLLLARAPVHARYAVDVLPVMLVLGVGAGLALPAIMTLAMSGVSPSMAGVASGLANTTQQVGGALGLAVLATLASWRTGPDPGSAEALAAGYHLAFVVAAGFIAAGVLLGLVVLRHSRSAGRECHGARVEASGPSLPARTPAATSRSASRTARDEAGQGRPEPEERIRASGASLG